MLKSTSLRRSSSRSQSSLHFFPNDPLPVAQLGHHLRPHRWGSGSVMEQAFTGFVAPPSPKSPYEILGIKPGASMEEIERAFRTEVKLAHPDTGFCYCDGRADCAATKAEGALRIDIVTEWNSVYHAIRLILPAL